MNKIAGSITYSIEDVDYWENDAFLVIGEHKFYFQWDALKPPTLEDALNFLQNELKVG